MGQFRFIDAMAIAPISFCFLSESMMPIQGLNGRLTWCETKPGTRAEIAAPVDAQETKFE
jgi:hypothetical protein